MFEYFFHTWNFYNNGSNIIFASQFPIYGWVLVFKNVALAQRFVYFRTVSLISFNMFLVAFYTLKRSAQKTVPVFLGSIVASLIYTLNPLVFSQKFFTFLFFGLIHYFLWSSILGGNRLITITPESFGKYSSLEHVLCIHGRCLGYASWFTYSCYCCSFKCCFEWTEKFGSSDLFPISCSHC